MNDTDFLAQAMRYQDSVLTPDEITALAAVMRDDPGKRQLFAGTQLRSMALHDRFRQEAFRRDIDTPVCARTRTGKSPRFTWITRLIASMAAGLVIGHFSASIVWAISSPRATTERLLSLFNGSFEEGHCEAGFPCQTGVWSGDEAAISKGKLHFVAPGSDSNDPRARAISCDLFQLVDLRPLRHTLNAEGDSVLELSAAFLDARPFNTKPSITFFGQLFLFQGIQARCSTLGPRASPIRSLAVALR